MSVKMIGREPTAACLTTGRTVCPERARRRSAHLPATADRAELRSSGLIGFGTRFAPGPSGFERRPSYLGRGNQLLEAIKFPGQQLKDLLGPHRVQIVGEAKLLRDDRDAPRGTRPAAAEPAFEPSPVDIPDKR